MVKLLLEKRCMNYDNDGCCGLPRLLRCAVPYDTNVVLGDVLTCYVMEVVFCAMFVPVSEC